MSKQSLNRDSPGLSHFQDFLRNVLEEEGEARDCSCRKERARAVSAGEEM